MQSVAAMRLLKPPGNWQTNGQNDNRRKEGLVPSHSEVELTADMLAQTCPLVRISAATALLAASACGQFLNRAVWLGSEEEGMRRNFTQGREYFLDRMSYVDSPPWWDRGLQRFGDEVQFRIGSVTSREFTIESHLNQAVELSDDVTFRYHYLQGENRDTRFVRNAVGLEYALDDRTAVFVQGTPFADKGMIDISVGAWLWRQDDQALRVMLTLVDAPSEKSQVVEFEQAPIGLHLAGTFGERDSHRLAFELAAQLPFEARQLDNQDAFEMQRYIGTIDAHLRLGARDWLVTSLESEYTDKRLQAIGVGSALNENFDRSFHQARVEWWRDGPTPWSVGVAHTFHSEHGRRPNDPANDLRTQRREWMAIARIQLPCGDQLSFEPQLLAGNVRQSFRDGVVDDRADGFEGKIAWNLRWDFSPNVTLAVIVSTQLDELAFGGGGAQFVARF
ncbi:MAG: hypothetical protein ACJAQZ_001874 [Planctomycetota bacterium]|jgi:hypothetical protein